MNTTTTYKISDHPDKAKVLDKHRLINVDYDWWHECVLDEWKDKLESLGFTDPEIEWSGFWGQGDGASFTASQVPLPSTDPSVTEAWNLLVGAAALLGETVTEDINDLAYGSVKRISGCRYYHEHSVDVDWEWNDPPFNNWQWHWAYDRVPDGLEPVVEMLRNAVESYFANLEERVRDLCREIYRDLEKEYEYLTSNEVVRDTLEANDYDFDEEGDIV